MSDATLKAGAGAPHDNAPGHDGPGAPVCSEAERLPFRVPDWAQNARMAGRYLARVSMYAERANPAGAMWEARCYAAWHADALDYYRWKL